MPETNDPLDAQLRQIAEVLVADPPGVPGFADLRGDPGPTLRRTARPNTAPNPVGPRHRRRTAVAVAVGAAAAAVLAVATTVALTTTGDDADEPTTVLAADPGLEPGPQRLAVDGVREVLADGGLVDLELDDLDGLSTAEPTVVFRADGSYVVVGVWPSDPLPADFNDLPWGLAVVGAGGSVEVERPIESSRLLGVTDGEAVLWRQPSDPSGRNITGPASIVVHDLATGAESPVGSAGEEPERWSTYRTAVVVGDELVTVDLGHTPEGDYPRPVTPTTPPADPEPATCTLVRLDLATGEETRTPLDPCVWGQSRVSPDGTRIAVAAIDHLDVDEPGPASTEYRIGVIDLDQGTVVYDERVADLEQMPDHPQVRGMAWLDDTTLRVAASDISTGNPDDLAIGEIAVP